MGGGGRGPGGRRPGYGPRSGAWWKTWTLKKALIVGGASFGGLVIVLFLAGFIGYSVTSIPTALASAQQQNSIVYYSDGKTEMGTIGTTNRTDLPLNQIPATLQDAFIAAEDKNFYHEGGVSPTGMLRATAADVVSSGGSLNGGSTLTQEFVRNYYGLGLQQTASRKIKEIFISEKLADSKSKQWILNSYLNMVYLGDNSYGVQAAAETYFGKSASQLSISQQALLAGLPQQPSTFPLEQFKPQLEQRWTYVLTQMVKDGYITQAQMSAQKFPTLLTWADPSRGEMAANINPSSGSDPWETYILQQVENELSGDGVSSSELTGGGLRIVTNVSLADEKAMYSAVNNTLSSSNLQANGSQVSSLPSWARTGAEVQDPQTGAILAEYPGPGQDQKTSVCEADGCFNNNAHTTTEQVGSSFKPYVIAAAVQQGMNVQSSVMDTSSFACIAPPSKGSTVLSQPITESMYKEQGANGSEGCPSVGYFKVENDGGEQIGKQNVGTGTGNYAGADYASDNVQDALAQSSNVAFTDLIHRTGTVAPETIAEEVGTNPAVFSPSGDPNFGKTVGIALGEANMTVENQASLVAMLADNGTYHTAHLIKSWQDTTGGVTHTPTVKTTQVLTPAQASQVQYAMEKTTVDGTAQGLVQLSEEGQQVIGKTGTTTSNHSGFFIGATPKFAMAVGMFTESNNSSENLGMLDSSDAANIYPTMIWNSFANAEFSSTDQGSFETLDTSGTTAWNMLGKLQTPKAKNTPNPKSTCKNGGGIFGLGGKNGNCTTAPTTPTTQPSTGLGGVQPSVQPTSTSTCQAGGLLGGCTQTQPAGGSTATQTTGPGGGGGGGGGGNG